MAKGDLKINALELPIDNIKFSQDWIDFEVQDRTINRTLVSDFIAFKRKFVLTWQYPLEGAFLADLLDLYIAKEDVTFTVTNADLTESLYTCKVDINGAYLREMLSGNYIFSGFGITLEEV